MIFVEARAFAGQRRCRRDARGSPGPCTTSGPGPGFVAEGLDPKHAIKQVDRLLSNSAISVWSFFFFALWVQFMAKASARETAKSLLIGPTSSETARPPLHFICSPVTVARLHWSGKP